MKTKNGLFILPNLLGEHKHHEMFLPASVDRAVETIDGLIAESATAGRRYLGRFKTKKDPLEIPIADLNEHSRDSDIDFLLEPILNGERWGLVSDGGLPCVADPGYLLVRRARQMGIPIHAFVGPSSIMLALMLSGMPGQRFTFHGYIEKEEKQRKACIRQMEKASEQDLATQIFIEAPYRNKHTLQSLVEGLKEETILCAAWDLTLPTQGVVSQSVALWKKSSMPNLEKKPAIFLISVG